MQQMGRMRAPAAFMEDEEYSENEQLNRQFRREQMMHGDEDQIDDVDL